MSCILRSQSWPLPYKIVILVMSLALGYQEDSVRSTDINNMNSSRLFFLRKGLNNHVRPNITSFYRNNTIALPITSNFEWERGFTKFAIQVFPVDGN